MLASPRPAQLRDADGVWVAHGISGCGGRNLEVRRPEWAGWSERTKVRRVN
jgi:hypothetical protein